MMEFWILLLLCAGVIGGGKAVEALYQRKIAKLQNLLIADLRGKRFWRVHFATPAFVASRVRFFPPEGGGVLIDEGDSLRVKGYWLRTSGTAIDVQLSKTAANTKWLGKRGSRFWAELNGPAASLCFSVDSGHPNAYSGQALSDLFCSVFPQTDLQGIETTAFPLEKNRGAWVWPWCSSAWSATLSLTHSCSTSLNSPHRR